MGINLNALQQILGNAINLGQQDYNRALTDKYEELRRLLQERNKDKKYAGLLSINESVVSPLGVDLGTQQFIKNTMANPNVMEQLINTTARQQYPYKVPEYELGLAKLLERGMAEEEALKLKKRIANRPGLTGALITTTNNIINQTDKKVKKMIDTLQEFLPNVRNALSKLERKDLTYGELRAIQTGLYKALSKDVGNITESEREQVVYKTFLNDIKEILGKIGLSKNKVGKADPETVRRLASSIYDILKSTKDTYKQISDIKFEDTFKGHPLVQNNMFGTVDLQGAILTKKKMFEKLLDDIIPDIEKSREIRDVSFYKSRLNPYVKRYKKEDVDMARRLFLNYIRGTEAPMVEGEKLQVNKNNIKQTKQNNIIDNILQRVSSQ